MRTALAILALAILASVSITAVPSAADKTPYEQMLESLPPMDPRDRAAFDKAAASMYREDCNCLTYLFEGVIKRADLPLSDANRRLLIEGLRRNLITPFGPNGQAS